MTKRHDPRLAKPYKNYNSAELADLFGVGITAVRAWKKAGLTPIDERRPYLFTGSEVRRFLEGYNKPRQPLQPGELYCVACKQPVRPPGGRVLIVPLSKTTGDLVADCPRCPAKPHRRVRLAEIGDKAGDLIVQYEDGTVAFNGARRPLHTACSREITR